jgi:hypothetical protein
MRFSKKEYQKIGSELSLFSRQGTTVGLAVANSFPQRHKLYRLALRATPCIGGNDDFINFKFEFENWCCQDLPSSVEPLKIFNNHLEDHDQGKLLAGIPEKLSLIFFNHRDAKRLRLERKKPGLNRLELIVAILFFHHLGDHISHLSMGAIERNFPATKVVKFAKEYLNAIRALIQALQEELANIEVEKEAGV